MEAAKHNSNEGDHINATIQEYGMLRFQHQCYSHETNECINQGKYGHITTKSSRQLGAPYFTTTLQSWACYYKEWYLSLSHLPSNEEI
jgi:hypothetical protein